MGSKTKIEWCDSTWNPVVGCSKVSDGCQNCYVERIISRQLPAFLSMRDDIGRRPFWGTAHFMTRKLEQPFHWRKPRRIFVCSMGDLFHERVTNEQIASVFGVMAATPQHTYCVLTKRVVRASEWFNWKNVIRESPWDHHAEILIELGNIWPLPNVWLGVSVENQKTADERIPTLLQIPAAKRFVSVEPLLSPVNIEGFTTRPQWGELNDRGMRPFEIVGRKDLVNWCIVGAETGHGKRPMDLDLARSLRDQCVAADVPFFFKKDSQGNHELDGRVWEEFPK